jgi:hypothetical protein
MANPNAAPQRPGKVLIDLTRGQEKVEVDGFRLEQYITGMTLKYDAAKRTPVLLLDLLPGTVEVTGTRVILAGEFREFLMEQGWKPPS